MRPGRSVLSAVAGLWAGLAIGFVLWGLQADELRWTLSNTNAELIQTQARLRDLSRASDERHQQLASALARARADLAKGRAEPGRSMAPVRNVSSINPSPQAHEPAPTVVGGPKAEPSEQAAARLMPLDPEPAR
jgi:hypothetical protein